MLAGALAALFLLLPAGALAGGGKDVVLEFSRFDYIVLYISLAIGLVALVFAWFLGRGVLVHDSGDERMQEVGNAIRQGALAYLRQQVRMMTLFVLLVAVGLWLLYRTGFGDVIGLAIALAFVAGVAASYIAGYTGMLMAVRANTRTAAAALTSYKRSLEVAFRAGGVAGMVTVGMGLVGATLIFLLARGDAMKVLIGFGFGGSLAALFMRVGGGIYTKAADVGADLVGKVEAGIPEDDPRNPATIADNVGDNVGDCAGMAADIFESYEVTLVAAIVLGAATAMIFDTATWMKLVLFALMARGVGILASIVGIYMVKGSEDVDVDPLRLIRRGFYGSAIIATALTAVLAYVMMGGLPAVAPQIKTNLLTSGPQAEREEMLEIQKIRDDVTRWMNRIIEARNEVAAQRGLTDVKQVALADLQAHPTVVALGFNRQEREATLTRIIAMEQDAFLQPTQLTADDLLPNPEIVALNLDDQQGQMRIQRAITMDLDTMPEPRALTGFHHLQPGGGDELLAQLSVMKPMDPTQAMAAPRQEHLSLGDFLAQYTPVVFDLTITQPAPPPPVERGETPPPPPEPVTMDIAFGPIHAAYGQRIIDREVERGTQIKVHRILRVDYLVNETPPRRDPGTNRVPANARPEFEMVAAISDQVLRAESDPEKGVRFDQPEAGARVQWTTDETGRDPVAPNMVQGGQGMQFWPMPAAELNRLAEQTPGFNPAFPPPSTMTVATVEYKVVGWYLFLICIMFGIAMAFIFELLTDYYVSAHKQPVKEVANVATTGPAPMIIQGFAYGLESSVFSLLAIVVSLVMPLLVFPPTEFGGYILSFYGIALVGLGLLTTTGFILAMDSFGPISDNAQGVFEMSGAGKGNKKAFTAIQRLDAAGNTTKALTKGFAIATAVVAAVALFHSYVEGAQLKEAGMPLEIPEIFLGMLIGGAAPFLFCAFMINAVGRSAFQLINEVRRQFREDPGILAGTSKPDYGRCVGIVTSAAQRELLAPGILAVALPVLVAFGFAIGKQPVIIDGQYFNLTGAQALGGYLAGIIVSGQLMAVLLANSGGLWDNSKKLIEDGMHGGKGTEAHKAGVVCDTVGDPFKDTAGPALNPLIKVMNLVALLLAPYVIQPYGTGALVSITLVAIAALVFAFLSTKRGSLSTELSAITGGPVVGLPSPDAPVPATERERTSEKQD
jgi:K(+)-stimulated pyrophosphate-energized sodium pump